MTNEQIIVNKLAQSYQKLINSKIQYQEIEGGTKSVPPITFFS